LKKLLAFSILLIFGFLLVFEAPHTQSLGSPPVTTSLAGTATTVDKVWFNSTGILTDQTVAANNPTPSDVQLGGTAGDMHIVGEARTQFKTIFYTISSGTDNQGRVNWQYWNGVVWKNFPAGSIVDDTNNFINPGLHFVNFTIVPSDWMNTTIPLKPPRLSFTAFYVRAVTIKAYSSNGFPLAGQVSLLLLPPAKPSVRVTVKLWNSTDVLDANVEVWNSTATPAIRIASHNVSTTGGLYIFNATGSSPEIKLLTGQSFFARAFKVGYANATSATLKYNSTSTAPFAVSLTLHGTLQVNVFKQPNPTQHMTFATGTVTKVLALVAPLGMSNATGTIEFGVNATKYPSVNVTTSSPGWVDNFTRNVSLRPWTTSVVRVDLLTTIRVSILSELNFPIRNATVTITDLTGVTISAIDGSSSDQDLVSNGIINLALNPGLVTNPISILVTRPGFSQWVQGNQNVTSSAQINVITSPGLLYNLHVQAWDELNNPLPLTSSDTNFTSTGLSISQYNFSKNTGYVAADPSTTGRLTIVKSGYVSTSTGSFTPPPIRNPAVNITYKQGGTAPGLLFTVKVVGAFNELGNPFQIGTNATITSSMGPPTSKVYFPATSNITVTAFAAGYVNASILVTPSSSSQTTVLFQTGGTGATVVKQGLQYTVKVVGVYNEIDSRFQLGTNATITSSIGTFLLNSGNGYLAAAAKIDVTASSPGYVNGTALNVTPTALSQTTILFRNNGNVSGLQFTVKVTTVSDELGNLLSSSVTTPGVTPVVCVSASCFAITGSSPITLTVTAAGFVTTTWTITPSTSSQTTVRFGTAGSPATSNAPGLLFTVKVVGFADQFGKNLANPPSVSAPGTTPVLKPGVFYFALASSTTVNLTATAPGYVNTNATVTPSSGLQSTVTFGTPGSVAIVKGPGLPFTLKVNVVQSWDGSPVLGATVSVYSDSAFTTLLTSATTDSSGNSYLAVSPTNVYVQVSMSAYPTYKGSALQLSTAQQTSSSVSFTAKTSTISASGTTVSATANTNISGLSFDSTSNTISLTSTSASAGNVNVTIPQSLIPSGATIRVTSGGQTVTYKTTSDSNNVYVQIPTASGTNNLQLAFPAPSTPSQSLLIPIVIAVVVIAALGLVAYVVLRRRKPAAQPKAK
jgi:hypothetical protein